MKITKEQLKQIIKEELTFIIDEGIRNPYLHGFEGFQQGPDPARERGRRQNALRARLEDLYAQVRRSRHPQARDAIEWATALQFGPRPNIELAIEKLEMILRGERLTEGEDDYVPMMSPKPVTPSSEDLDLAIERAEELLNTGELPQHGWVNQNLRDIHTILTGLRGH